MAKQKDLIKIQGKLDDISFSAIQMSIQEDRIS